VAFGVRQGMRGPSARSRHGAWVFVAGLASLSLLCLAVSRTDFREPRYLYAAYAGFAPLVGGLVDALWSRRAVYAAALVAAVLGLNLGSEARAPAMKHNDAALGFFGEMDFTRLLRDLRSRNVRAVYASYWAAYRLAFLSGGAIAASPFGSGTNGVARIASLKAQVDADPAPAFLLRDDDREALGAFLSARGFARQRTDLDGFSLFTDVAPKALRIIRRCRCIPATVSPGEVAITDLGGPDRVRAGGFSTHRVRVRIASPRPLSGNVHLSYHWLRPDGSVAVWDGQRASAAWPARTGQVDVEIQVRADVAPGEYDLVFDLVDEAAAWFESMSGTPPPRRRVVVESAS
jgi:hypothetical protein